MDELRQMPNNPSTYDMDNGYLGALMLPPFSVEAEQSVIGGLLLHNSAFDRIEGITAAEFYRNDHRKIFAHIHSMLSNNEAVDVITLATKMHGAGELVDVGGVAYLQKIMEGTPGAANIRQYADVVRDKAVLRGLMRVGDSIAALATEAGDLTPEQRLEAAQTMLSGLERKQSGEAKVGLEITASFSETLRRRAAKEMIGVSSHFIDLDRTLNGLQRGDLIVVAGRPSMGKSALSFQIAEQVALSGGVSLCFSMEMSTQQFMDRVVARVGGVKLADIITGDAYGTEAVAKALGRVEKSRLFVDDSPGLTVNQIRARARAIRRKHGLDLVVIDYLQLMPGNGDSRNAQIEEITRGIKALARELDVPVILLSQLNRKCEERTDKRPMMSDLRESGAIEQDADVILFIYRHEKYYPDETDWAGIAEILIAKNRQGATTTVPMTFWGAYTAFKNFKGELPQRGTTKYNRGNLT
jgi:replicative DNA helicase